MSLPAVRGIEGSDGGETGLHFREIDVDHPLFATIFEKDTKASDLRRLSPRISKTLQLRPAARSRSVITLSNGGGFLIEQPVGAGRVAMFSCAPSLSWTEFPMKGLFAPLAYRTVVFLATGSERTVVSTVGSEAAVTLRAAGPAGSPGTAARVAETRYALRLPDGVSEFIVPSPSVTGIQFKVPLLTLPGHYRLTAGDSLLAVLPANLPPRESDLTKASTEAVDRFISGFGFEEAQVRRLPPGEGLPARITEARFGMELWKYCLGLVLLLSMLELAINRRAGGEAAADERASG